MGVLSLEERRKQFMAQRAAMQKKAMQNPIEREYSFLPAKEYGTHSKTKTKSSSYARSDAENRALAQRENAAKAAAKGSGFYLPLPVIPKPINLEPNKIVHSTEMSYSQWRKQIDQILTVDAWKRKGSPGPTTKK